MRNFCQHAKGKLNDQHWDVGLLPGRNVFAFEKNTRAYVSQRGANNDYLLPPGKEARKMLVTMFEGTFFASTVTLESPFHPFF